MSEKTALERFQGTLADWAASTFTPQTILGKIEIPADEYEVMDTVFRRFTELTDCVERLDLCLQFIKAPLPRRKGLKADDYLMYHITFYIQEIYILNERFDAYAKSVLRLRKKRVGLDGVDQKKLESLLKRIREALAPIVGTRGSHVHSRAFRDEEMRELSSVAFLAVHKSEDPVWMELTRQLYPLIRSSWVKRLSANREAIAQLLNEYCEIMHAIVVGGSPSLLPNNSSKPTPLRGAA
jgi:hypothetical protein